MLALQSPTIKYFLFIYFFKLFIWAFWSNHGDMWDINFPTRDGTDAPCIGSSEP